GGGPPRSPARECRSLDGDPDALAWPGALRALGTVETIRSVPEGHHATPRARGRLPQGAAQRLRARARVVGDGQELPAGLEQAEGQARYLPVAALDAEGALAHGREARRIEHDQPKALPATRRAPEPFHGVFLEEAMGGRVEPIQLEVLAPALEGPPRQIDAHHLARA